MAAPSRIPDDAKQNILSYPRILEIRFGHLTCTALGTPVWSGISDEKVGRGRGLEDMECSLTCTITSMASGVTTKNMYKIPKNTNAQKMRMIEERTDC